MAACHPRLLPFSFSRRANRVYSRSYGLQLALRLLLIWIAHSHRWDGTVEADAKRTLCRCAAPCCSKRFEASTTILCPLFTITLLCWALRTSTLRPASSGGDRSRWQSRVARNASRPRELSFQRRKLTSLRGNGSLAKLSRSSTQVRS
jgi:hypothetical protein